MMINLQEVVKATNGRLVKSFADMIFSNVWIDTRHPESDGLFVAIKGAHFDGHEFVGEAISLGAKGAIVKRGYSSKMDVPFIEVEDTERALGDLARYYRTQFKAPCVAITGSNGKSTTKEMIYSVAGVLGDVLKTEGNFNNLIGLPLTLFRFEKRHKVAIIEMGMNAEGEIRRLTEIAEPDIGLITNVTAAHLEKLHSVEAVAHAKGELFETMRPDATIVVNGEDPWVVKIAAKFKGRKIVFGMQNSFDVRFLHMETNSLDSIDLKLAVFEKEFKVTLPVPGAHNVMNALAAVSVGVALGIDAELAIDRLSKFTPMSMRLERVQLANGVRVVNDSYNANPESMKAALRTVGAAKRAGGFIAVLGDMLELGGASRDLHKEVGKAAIEYGVDGLYVTGEFADALADGAIEAGLDPKNIIISRVGGHELAAVIEKKLKAGDVVLVKGSRGMKMERIVEHLKNTFGMG